MRVFYKYCLYNLVPSINDVLETGYQNGAVSGDKALCLNFLLDVVYFCFLLVSCLIILLVSAYAWFLVVFASTITLGDHSYNYFLINLKFKELREDLHLQFNVNHPIPTLLHHQCPKVNLYLVNSGQLNPKSFKGAWYYRLPQLHFKFTVVYPHGEGDSVLWVEERMPS